MTTVKPPRWRHEDFQRDLDRAVELFRARRLKEPVDQYRKEFDEAVARVEHVLRKTDNLTATLPGAPNAPEVALVHPRVSGVAVLGSGYDFAEGFRSVGCGSGGVGGAGCCVYYAAA